MGTRTAQLDRMGMTVARMVAVALVVLVLGALLLLGSYLLARSVAAHMARTRGPFGARLRHAFAAVRFDELARQVRSRG